MLDFQEARKQIQIDHPKASIYKIYSTAHKIYPDPEIAKEFLLTEGGLSLSEYLEAQYQRTYQRNYYKSKKAIINGK